MTTIGTMASDLANYLMIRVGSNCDHQTQNVNEHLEANWIFTNQVGVHVKALQ